MGKPRILIIYTGGTIGMIQDVATSSLVPFTLEAMLKKIPSILDLGIELYSTSLEQIIDSSNITPLVWVELVETIHANYATFDGFVILHGSDTMAYTASALSFMLDGLSKPIILTGSQLPIGLARSDARENLITSLSIAAMQQDGVPMVNEVCIYFEDRLFRGNRTHKFNTEHFDAFRSVNYPILADAGVQIALHTEHLLAKPSDPFKTNPRLCTNISVLRLFPGMDIRHHIDFYIERKFEGLIIETYGSGNGPTDGQFISGLEKLNQHGILTVNITQCRGGRVDMEKYATGRELAKVGVVSGKDMTIEAAITKMMHVLEYSRDFDARKKLIMRDLKGELTE
jgi:L-asparaginase